MFFFKYYDFFITSVNAVFGADYPLLDIALPLGISFFTFQQLSYLIDSFRGEEGIASYDFLDYALFVTYFPQLVAGPIVTHDEMVPQFAAMDRKRFDRENFSRGVYAFSRGLAKKVLLADALGKVVDVGYADIAALNTGSAVFVMLAYTMQIYFDFSGYSDMALGIGKMMNIDIAVNFNSPYRAYSIVDFWKRWHITLTRFFRKYVYYPLGGNRKGSFKTYVNIMIVFLLSGLWHGASWTFVLWGALHGLCQVITKMLRIDIGQSKPVRLLQWAGTFLLVNLLWVLFRADTLAQAAQLYGKLMSFPEGGLVPSGKLLVQVFPVFIQTSLYSLPNATWIRRLSACGFLLAAVSISVFARNTSEELAVFKPTALKGLAYAFLVFCSVISFAGVSSFLYWNF